MSAANPAVYYLFLIKFFTFYGAIACQRSAIQELHEQKEVLLHFRSQASDYISNNSVVSLLRDAATELASEISPSCAMATGTMLYGLLRGEPWALQMIDASGKFATSGLLIGNFFSLGSFTECMNTSQATNGNTSTSNSTVHGQYCLVSLGMRNGTNVLEDYLRFKWGVCVPNACNTSDVDHFANYILKLMRDIPAIGKLINRIELVDTTCHLNEWELNELAIVGLCVVAVLVLLMVVGSVHDTLFHHTKGRIGRGVVRFFRLYTVSPLQFSEREADVRVGDRSLLVSTGDVNAEQSPAVIDLDAEDNDASELPEVEEQLLEKGNLGKLLATFSVRSNGATILNTKLSGEQLDCLHGLRVISMIWIIVGHSYEAALNYCADAVLVLDHYLNSWSFQFILNASFAVDTFFVISGLLVTFVTLKYISKVGGPRRFKWHFFYVHRYLRLTPVYAVIVFLYVAVYPYLAAGPQLPQQSDKACLQYWWTNFLYINNFYNLTAQCYGHTWYLANDMQFFVLSPLVLVPLYAAPLVGLILILTLVATSVVSTAVISTVNNFQAIGSVNSVVATQVNSMGPVTEMNEIYVKPYCRVGAYAIGMLVGYVLFRAKRKLTLNAWVLTFGWAVSTALALLVLLVLYDAYRGLATLSTAESAAYLSLSRIAWSLSVGWVILACSTGYGGWVNKFLSWKLFAPLSRLTYCTYLLHLPLIYILIGYVQSPSDLREFPIFYYVAGNVVMGYAVALGFSLAVEAPFLALEKLILGRD